MRDNPSLDDVALFLLVARSGSLSAAARTTQVPVPTLSRRMTTLERQTGRRLFLRGSEGYKLTAQGRSLRDEAAEIGPLADRLRRWIRADTAPPRVRVTAGVWTSRFLARNIAQIWNRECGWVPEFLASNARLDIARREADIGIRNRRPDQTWLAGRRTVSIRYAGYGVAGCGEGYVSLSDSAPTTPSERWLRATYPDRIVTTASDARLALDLALSGVGQVLLPTFHGDSDPRLTQTTPPIDDLTHDEWLISHHETRNDPAIRAALDAIHGMLTERSLRP